MGPAPVIAESSSHRFCVSTLNNSAGVSKLMNAPCGRPSKARRKRRLASSRDETSKVTVRMSGPPEVDVFPEVGEQLRWGGEGIGGLLLAKVLVISLAGLVVIAPDADAV